MHPLTNVQAWRRRHFRDAESYDEQKLRALAIAGFNSPPSQYQLHLQFMLPPFLPFQYYQYLMVWPRPCAQLPSLGASAA